MLTTTILALYLLGMLIQIKKSFQDDFAAIKDKLIEILIYILNAGMLYLILTLLTQMTLKFMFSTHNKAKSTYRLFLMKSLGFLKASIWL